MRRLLSLTLLCLVGTGCGGSRPAREEAPVASEHEEAAELADPVADEGSIYDLDLVLTAADGRAVPLSDLRGQPFVASMIYTRCTSVCPRVTADLQRLERALPGAARERLKIRLFSLDPERDRPEALRRFAADHGLDSTRWSLYSSHEDDMRTLAAVFGVRHRPDGGGEIAHSAIVVVVDAQGRIRHRQIGMKDDVQPLAAAVSEIIVPRGR